MLSGQMTMLQQIEDILGAPTTGEDAPSLAQLEDTLTDGYARALALEAEHWRLERRLGEVARTAGGRDFDVASLAEEISSLAGRVANAEDEITHLRRLLRSLQERARTRRRAA